MSRTLAVRGDTSQAIMRRPYLDSVSKEILRYCPDIPFALRQASTEIEINGWRLPAGTTLGIGIYLTHRRASTFPDPERFWPERFLSARPSRFEYLPFGGGRRGCVAGPLYVFVQKLILAAVTERFRLRLCDRRANPVTLMAIVSSPSRPLWVIAEPTQIVLGSTALPTSTVKGNRNLNVLLVALGFAGDVFPFLGVGRHLRALGHQVTLLTNSHFERACRARRARVCRAGHRV